MEAESIKAYFAAVAGIPGIKTYLHGFAPQEATTLVALVGKLTAQPPRKLMAQDFLSTIPGDQAAPAR